MSENLRMVPKQQFTKKNKQINKIKNWFDILQLVMLLIELNVKLGPNGNS